MAEPAIKRMTLDEFVRWDDGTETHYELVGGSPAAMAPPAEAHRMLARGCSPVSKSHSPDGGPAMHSWRPAW